MNGCLGKNFVKKYLLAWEMGGGLGHVMALHEIARQLQADDHQVLVVLKNLDYAFLFEKMGINTCIAPSEKRYMPYHSSPNSMAEILWCNGYGNTANLSSLVAAWTMIIEQFKPDLVIADYAPTALLSAKANNIKSMAVGCVFSFPPTRSGVQFRYVSDAECSRLSHVENSIALTINCVLANHGVLSDTAANQAFYGDTSFLCGFPSLDYYAGKRIINYMRPIKNNGDYLMTAWQGKPYKVLVYIKNNYEALYDLFNQINAFTQAEFIVYLAGPISEGLNLKSHVQLYREPINIDPLLERADLLICHAGSGLVNQALMKQVPLLCLPMHYEQFLMATRVQELGVGVLVLKEQIDNIIEISLFNSDFVKRYQQLRLYDEQLKVFSPSLINDLLGAG